MGYRLGRKSLSRLKEGHPDLQSVVKRAIEITEVDFTVMEVLRSTERQQKLFAAGSSQIDGVKKKGRHQTGHAVDLGAYVDGQIDWSWPLYYKIARAVQRAAQELGVPIRWGGAWDRELTGSNQLPQSMMNAYVMKRKLAGKNAFPDGPHFELPEKDYPA